MNEEKREILEHTAKEYFSSAEDELKKEKYNSSLVLYFKSLIAFVDLYILKNFGKTPSSHSERFKIAKEKFPKIYDIIDKDFPFYQDSYVQKISKELAEVIKEDAKIMAEKNKIKL